MIYYDSKNNNFLKVEYDQDAENPRKYAEYESTFVTFERNYISPDENPFNDFSAMLENFSTKCTGNMRKDLDALKSNGLKKDYLVLPVWKYEHSCLLYRAADRYPFHDHYPSCTPGYEGGWDGGLCGVIYKKLNGKTVEEIETELKAEVDEYSQWANGEVLEVIAYDREGEEIDCCGGFYSRDAKALIVEFTRDYLGLDTDEESIREIPVESLKHNVKEYFKYLSDHDNTKAKNDRGDLAV